MLSDAEYCLLYFPVHRQSLTLAALEIQISQCSLSNFATFRRPTGSSILNNLILFGILSDEVDGEHKGILGISAGVAERTPEVVDSQCVIMNGPMSTMYLQTNCESYCSTYETAACKSQNYLKGCSTIVHTVCM